MASPLIRTLETAAGVFGQHAPATSERGVWMNEIQTKEGKQAAMTRIGLPETPVIANEDCRETIGVRVQVPDISPVHQALSLCSSLRMSFHSIVCLLGMLEVLVAI